jgi:mannose-6-phosphate isomerase-like protein (cupin superfamily)
MPTLIESPARVAAAGEPPKVIEEFVGRAASGTLEVSVARMRSPAGWQEPGQRPEFTEFTVVLGGCLVVEHDSGELRVSAGQAVITRPGEWVRYRTEVPTEYLAVCLPAFSAEAVHRDR